jgi:hypothetical protein
MTGDMPLLLMDRPKPKRGRPTKAEAARRKELRKSLRTWGGKRKGAGRPKRTGPPRKSPIAVVRMDTALGEAIRTIPKGLRSEYLRQAVDLMKDIMPPEKFVASGRKNAENTGDRD